jgi:hypothetical protein
VTERCGGGEPKTVVMAKGKMSCQLCETKKKMVSGTL